MSLRKSAFVVTLSAGLFGVAPCALLAQDQAIVEVPNAGSTVVGEVNATSVNVRSGPAESYYPTMMLNKGDRVVAVGHRFDWLKIIPPQGSFSYIAKIYVDREGEGAAGRVNRDDVLVRAGSDLNPLKTQPQMKLNRGATVNITGEADEYYKISPPEGAYLYIAKRFVDPVDAAPEEVAVATAAPAVQGAGSATAEPAQAQAEAPAAQEPGSVAPTAVTPRVQPPAAPKSADAVAAELEAEFRKLERRFEQLSEQPLDEQPVAELLAGYRELKDDNRVSSTARRMSEFRVRYLEVAEKQQAELRRAKQEEAEFAARQLQLDTERKQIEQRVKETTVTMYTAVGQLQTSSVQKDGQPLLRLVDPANGRTLVYLSVADARQRGMVGQFIGVRGNVALDPVLSLDIIEPTEMEQVDQARVMRGVTARIYPPSLVRNAPADAPVAD